MLKLKSFKGTLALLGLGTVIVPMVLFFGGGTPVSPIGPTQAVAKDAPKAAQAAMYDKDGQLLRPADHHEWIFVGAPVTPNDMNDGKAAFPEFHNVYIDPASFASYKKSGKFPEGTVVLKELVSVGSKEMPSGKGYFQGDFVSLEAMVKDTKRFQEEPGGWAFFRFGEAPNYTPAGARMKTADCNQCHAAATEDYMFTATYPVLRAAKAKLTAK